METAAGGTDECLARATVNSRLLTLARVGWEALLQFLLLLMLMLFLMLPLLLLC